jgi:hypothetical protein
MKNNVSKIEEPQFITKEFADTIAGKTLAPYLRVHDPVQKALTEFAASGHAREAGVFAYCDRMIHFWREVSLARMPRAKELRQRGSKAGNGAARLSLVAPKFKLFGLTTWTGFLRNAFRYDLNPGAG